MTLHFDSGRVAGPGTRNPIPACFGKYGSKSYEERCEALIESPEPTTTDVRAAIDCEECKDLVAILATCWGCERPFKLRKDGSLHDSEFKKIAFAPGVDRRVHRGRGDRASTPCLEKARARTRFCAGCGSERLESMSYQAATWFDLCADCSLLRDEGLDHRAARASEGKLESYVIDEEFFPIPDTNWEDRKLREALREALAEACAGVGRKWRKDGTGLRLLGPDEDYPKDSSYRDGQRGPCVELTPEQAAALRRVLESWRAVFEAVARVHRDAGRSVLLSLAKGELTVDQFNAMQRGEKGEEE